MSIFRKYEPSPPPEGVRVEVAAELRGRTCAVVAWFTGPEHEVGILRPQLVTALAIDVDGEVHEVLDRAELEPLLPRLRERAEMLLEVAPC